MSDDPVRISRKELSSEEIMDRISSGRRVIVTVEVLGVERDVTLRKTDEEYVCDTGFKLMNYEEEDGLKSCIERLRLTDTS
ncbi:hypothetical protein [Halovenus salina]|uniref:DUF8001 domain-containing protein n=1 Tax=Halovenus salina TaxID=1510225 RepID=A0ABD5W1N5_9EURY|nr:hypothetical protein [Halovenus salina]